MREVKKVSIHQSSKVIATMMLLSSLVFILPFTFYIMFFSDSKLHLDSLILLLFPLGYALIGYIMQVIIFFFYNLAAKLVGGIEIEVE